MPLVKQVKAVIFDMDGVISDTQRIHSRAESELLKNYGINLDPDTITLRYAGVGDNEMFLDIFKNQKDKAPLLDALIAEKWKAMESLLEGGIEAVEGTREFIETLCNRDVPLAVASASQISFIERVLRALDLINKFGAIVSSEEVAKGKPEPDVFLLAAQRLGVAPENCLVVEDAVNGMVAAKRAKMQCIGLVKDTASQIYPADLLVSDLRDVPVGAMIYG